MNFNQNGMCKIAIIGAGISGLSAAHFLKSKYDVTLFEKENKAGGLIKCRRVNGCLFHICGGHVFNSKRQDVLDWFWSVFQRENEFSKTDRNSVVFMEGGEKIPYPIENHMYLFDDDTQKHFIKNLFEIRKGINQQPYNFEEFLKNCFGETLYEIYFKPYNEKVWRRNLKNVPISWLEGKLPMPSVEDMIFNNMNHVEEKDFVHATFWYEKVNGSQYIVDKLAQGLKIVYGSNISSIDKIGDKWEVHGQLFDKILFCGNIKDMVKAVKGIDLSKFENDIEALEYHGTTSVFCEIDSNPYSWIYLPSKQHESHRIICTGNFAKSNNKNLPKGRITATIEFTDSFSKEEILENLTRIPLRPTYIDHQYNRYTYPIQNINTRLLIQELKHNCCDYNLHFTGRFADWEYYNMDAAIGASMDLCKTL